MYVHIYVYMHAYVYGCVCASMTLFGFVYVYCPIPLLHACISQVFFEHLHACVVGDWKWGGFPACSWLALVVGMGDYVLTGVEIGGLLHISLFLRVLG